MNRKNLFFLVLILVSCEPTKSIVEKSEAGFKNEKTIKYFGTEESELFTTYKSIGLSAKNKCMYKDSTLINCYEENYEYFNEVFDKRYLIITFRKKRFVGWAGADSSEKDSIFIYDLKKSKKAFGSLKNVRFAYSKKYLFQIYHGNIKMDEKYSYLHAIDSINLDTNELFLVNPNFKIVEYKLKSVN